MGYICSTLIYLGFYGCIGIACYSTKSIIPLIALLLTPSITITNENKVNTDENM